MDPEVKRLLDLRLAKGEISREDYLATLKALTEGDKSEGASSVFSQASGAFNAWLKKANDPHGEFSYKNVEPTDEAPLAVNDELFLFGSRLEFRQTTSNYSDIRCLGYEALRQTTNNSLSRYYANLLIFRSTGEPIKVLSDWKHKVFGRQQNGTKVKLVENAYSFLAAVTFQQRLQRCLDELAHCGYMNICKMPGKPEVRLFRDGFIEKEGKRINLTEAHSKKMIQLGYDDFFFRSSPGEFIFGQTGMTIFHNALKSMYG